MIHTDKYMELLLKQKLTQRQLLFLHLTITGRKDWLDKYIEVYGVENNVNEKKFLDQREFDELVKLGFIVEEKYKDKVYYKIAAKFIEIYGKPETMLNQLLAIYPAFYVKDKIRYPLKTVDVFKFKDIYAHQIFNVYEEHLEILKDVHYGVENNLISIGIEKFITSKYWESIRELRLETDTTNAVNTRKVL